MVANNTEGTMDVTIGALDGGTYNALNMTRSDVNGGPLHDNDTDYYNYYLQECGTAILPDFPEYHVGMALQNYLYPVLLVLGTLGNIACLPLLWRLSTYAWSSCLYLAVLSVVELVVLYIRCGGFWLGQVAGANPFYVIMGSSDALCKINLFLLNFLLEMWPWLMVAVGVELLIATRFPLKTYEYCTTERARATILLLIILLVCLNLNYFWTWGLEDETQCVYNNNFASDFMETVWPSIAMAVEHIVPLFVVAICFFVSTLSLLKSDRDLCSHGDGCCGRLRIARGCSCGEIQRQASYEPILRKYFLDMEALQQMKRAVLIVEFMFVVVKTFTFAVELSNALQQREVIVVPCDKLAEYMAKFYLVKAINECAVYCFFSLKFFIYFAVCKRFRRLFVGFVQRVCTLCCRRGRGSSKEEEEEAAARSQHQPLQQQQRRGLRGREDEEGEAEGNGRVVRDNETNCLRLQQNSALAASAARNNNSSRPHGAHAPPATSSAPRSSVGADYGYGGELNNDYGSHDFPPPPPPLNKTTQI